MTPNTLRPPHGGSGVQGSEHGERRREARAWVDLPADAILDGFSHPCRVIDTSPTGMVVVLSRALARRAPRLIGTYEIHTGPSQILHLQARHVWRRGAIQAARFVGLRREEKTAVATMVGAGRRPASNEVDRLDLAERRDRLIQRARTA